MWLPFGLLFVLQLVTCLKDAENTEWNRHGYLVKVLSEFPDRDRVIGCTGTFIAPSLVLTASKCIANEESNTIVIYAKGTYHRKRAVVSIARSGDLAVLEIRPIKDEMCPRSPAPVRLSRLPIKISLKNAPWEKLNLNDITETKCRITGFETTSVANFSSVHKTMQTPVHVIKDGESLIVDVSSGSPVCWDDVGIPLECMVEEKRWTQVGLLYSVMTTTDNPTNTNSTSLDCDDITTLFFTTFSDDTLPTLLESHTVEMLNSTKNCFTQPIMEEEEEVELESDYLE